jgi:hypothetical protein
VLAINLFEQFSCDIFHIIWSGKAMIPSEAGSSLEPFQAAKLLEREQFWSTGNLEYRSEYEIQSL